MEENKKIITTLHSLHCGGACILKLQVENGRVTAITSEGDILRADSASLDESLSPIQRRACLKGYAELKRIYAPDRIKYPLKQTLERGSLKGFKRISWDEALDTVAGWYHEMQHRKDSLGYLPVWDEGGITPQIGPCLKRFGNFSFGNLAAAMFASLGRWSLNKGNPVMDIFNSKYIIVWASDHRASRPNLPFIMMKAKEMGIPITVVDSRYTDTAAAMATGKGAVPGFICVRPGTDTVLLAAMANVIYRKKIYAAEFIKQFCFGFYPGDSIVSQSSKVHPLTGEPFRGQHFKVPAGQSFVEYLDSLEVAQGGYEGVLRWASRVTAVPAAVIEAFAIEYAVSKPAFIYSSYHGGAQRTHSGMYFSWMLIALSAITGNLNRRGGGFGEISLDDGYKVKLGPAPDGVLIKNGPAPPPRYKPLLFSVFKDSDVILNGLDGRTPSQLRADVLAMNNIDLGPEARLSLEMYVKGAICSNTFNQTQNINKRVLAWKKLKHTVAYERFLTPTAAWSDIILPSTTDFEESSFGSNLYSDTFVINGPLEWLYESRPDWWINQQLAARTGIEYPQKNLTDLEIMRRQWSQAVIPAEYQALHPEVKLPAFDQLLDKGHFSLPVPVDQTVIHLVSVPAGRYDTETGRINFYSPYLAERGRAVLEVYKAQHVRSPEGFEDVLAGGRKTGFTGLNYSLQFISPHVPQRAHTTYDNVPLLKEQAPHAVEIHPLDAAARDIRDGDSVYVFNDLGCLKLPARVTRRILPGVVAIGQGAWYRPSCHETYRAWFDADYDGQPEPHEVPVDVGGCVNSITADLNSGVLDPFGDSLGILGMNAGGGLCEISKIKPG